MLPKCGNLSPTLPLAQKLRVGSPTLLLFHIFASEHHQLTQGKSEIVSEIGCEG